MKKITLALLCLLFSFSGYATHVASAEIRYEYTGIGNKYRIYLSLLKACEPNNASLALTAPIQITSSCSQTIFRSLTQVGAADTISAFCPTTIGSCHIPGSIYPAFERRIYSDTVSLTPCADWTIKWSLCCRNNGVVNLATPGAFSNYVESFLNNSASLNTSAWIPNPSPLLVTQGATSIIPMNAADAENDSLAYDWFQPMDAGGVPIAYSAGHSFTSPLGAGSSLSINTANQTLNVMAANSGKFALGLKVSEYRNGQLVGYTMRDFTIVSLSSSNLTIPMPASNAQFHHVTCPGASNNLTLSFNDAQPTDSVYLTVTSPSLPGWTFNTSVVPGVGTASANINWTTPASMNPATLPQFYFLVHARDNACPRGSAYYALVVQTAQCNTDSVWAGDANGDWTVNIYDPLAIAVAYGKTGAARPNATTNWQAEYCPAWVDSFMNGVNMKHADCNGDGIIDTLDLGAVNSNWGMVHQKGTPRAKTTAVPDLWFDISNVSFHIGSTVAIPIMLGSSTYPINDFYGIATDMSVSGITLAAPVSVSHTAGWVGNGSNTLQFAKADAMNSGNISWAYARRDHQEASGQGAIGLLHFTVPPSASVGQQILLSFGNTRIVDKDMNEITAYNVIDTTVLVTPLSVANVSNNIGFVQVVPNPSRSEATLQIYANERAAATVTVKDMAGRTVVKKAMNVVQGVNHMALPVSEISGGVYVISVAGEKGSTQTIKWIRE